MEEPDFVAVIGMAGRFPGARNVEEFWRNLREGVESIRTFSEAELLAAGVPAGEIADANYVRRGVVVPDFDRFDASFFGFTPNDAKVTDPQQRVFMETAWEALEHAGYAPGACPGAVGVFAGTENSSYFLEKIFGNRAVVENASAMQIAIGNEKDFLCTRVAYHLGLRGPAVTVQTACSTSLVAVHLACQSVLNGESDIALAGGVCLHSRPAGYRYQLGDINSPDGRCRAFDEHAAGTVPGAGAGIVVLKRLSRALADGDTIHAVIRGTAINNDAADKVGYGAPSVNGQAAVIAEAMAVADVDPQSISYVEAHGTGTVLGDPIEIKALQQAFGAASSQKHFCALGSLKTNVGHLDAAAGIAGLIKAVLTARDREIAPSLHFTSPNPHIDFANGPFYVNTRLRKVGADVQTMRVGVSSFGIGGTNAHAVVEEPPPVESPRGPRTPELIVLSGKTPEALAASGRRLSDFFAANPAVDFADAAFTLQIGRMAFGHRRAIVCAGPEDAARQLATPAGEHEVTTRPGAIVFLFPGQGAQYPGMARQPYRDCEIFRTEVDRCAEILRAHLGFDLRSLLLAEDPAAESGRAKINETQVAQPALFTVEYALARQLEHWGVRPDAMLGHSLGEYVAACLAGVFTPEDALALVAQRGRLVSRLSPGRMLAVHADETTLRSLGGSGVCIAAMNAPALGTVSGTDEAIGAFERTLTERGIDFHALRTSHAFHSRHMDPVLDEFAAAVARCARQPPRAPFVSNVTGTWITERQATSAEYWRDHMRMPVRFSSGVQTLGTLDSLLCIEVGPGRALTSILRMQDEAARWRTVTSLPDSRKAAPAEPPLLRAVGAAWMNGASVDWRRLRARRGRRIPLPTYPFARTRHWIGDATIPAGDAATPSPAPTHGTRSARPALAIPYVAPRNDIEKMLVAIWQGLFGIDALGVDDDFFDLGGHSLMATQILSQVRKELGIALPLRSLFEVTTVAGLAVRIEEVRADEESTRRAARASIDQMSPAQIAELLAEKRKLRG
jgi:acyl transferase domain-containing protein/acyl carrier protein